jgi:hypothetical protein
MTRIEVPNDTLKRRTSGRGMRYFLTLLLHLIIGLGLWTWFSLSWSYSEGQRAGLLQKFSRRGYVCKTSEGELAMYVVSGVSPQIWDFTVRDAGIAEQLNKAVGHRVQLHYTEHVGVPSNCFGETRYFVDRVLLEDNVPGPIP